MRLSRGWVIVIVVIAVIVIGWIGANMVLTNGAWPATQPPTGRQPRQRPAQAGTCDIIRACAGTAVRAGG